MSCERYRDALTDVAAGGPVPAEVEAHLASCGLCREELAGLRSALALAEAEMGRIVNVEPSPGLAARIRQSVATSDSEHGSRVGWLRPAMAASAALLVAFAVWVLRAPSPAPVAVDRRPAATPRESRPAEGRTRTSEAPDRTRTSEAPEPTAPSPRARALVPPREGSEMAAPQHPQRPARAVPAAPEVLVPQGEAEALVRFAAIVQRNRHAPAAFLAAGQPSPDLADPAPLDIEPLEIVPLDPAEGPGTD